MFKIKFSISFLALFIFISCSSDSNEIIDDTTSPELNISIAGIGEINNGPIVVGSKITINIEAQDASGLQKVEAFIDNEKVGEDMKSPFQIVIDLSGYISKTKSSKTQLQDYTLKVTATDKAGNESTVEKVLNIDNNAPVISDVSLEEGTVIGDESNSVTFKISDNDEIDKVTLYLNEEVFTEIADQEYIINLNTLELKDGENILKIVASDTAENSTSYEVTFVVDNTGPEVSFQNIVENQIMDKPLLVDLKVQDTYSEVATIIFSVGDEEKYTIDGKMNPQWDFNPNNHSTGETLISVKATDALGNSSTAEVPIEILRRLITINIPQGFYDNFVDRLYVFASDAQGKLLTNERITPESRKVFLRTSENVTASFEFMITFAFNRSNQTNTVSDFVTVANISNFEEINLQIPLRTNPYDAKYLPATGFDQFDSYNTWGSSPFGSGQLQEANQIKNSEFRLLRRTDLGPIGLATDKIYVALENLTLATYKYAIFDWNLDGVDEVREDMFTNQGIEQRRYESEISNENHQRTSLLQYGYFNDYEYENNIYHYDQGNGYQVGHPTNRFFYHYNTIFYKRRYDLSLNNYLISAVGSPETYYPKTDLDFNYTFTNNELHFQSEGSSHIAGAFTLIDLDDSTSNMVNGKEVIYGWNVVFDSQSQNPIKLPELPEELQTWEFYSFYEQNDLKLEQIEIRKYQTISNYAEYLNKVIKPNKHWYLASPKREVVFKRPISEHTYTRSNWYNFLID